MRMDHCFAVPAVRTQQTPRLPIPNNPQCLAHTASTRQQVVLARPRRMWTKTESKAKKDEEEMWGWKKEIGEKEQTQLVHSQWRYTTHHDIRHTLSSRQPSPPLARDSSDATSPASISTPSLPISSLPSSPMQYQPPDPPPPSRPAPCANAQRTPTKTDAARTNADSTQALFVINEKYTFLTPFDVTYKILGSYALGPNVRETLGDKMELYFHDHSFVPLFMQENYLKTQPVKVRNLEGPNAPYTGRDIILGAPADGADIDNDIYIFLQHSFKEMQWGHPNFPQPSDGDLAKLASRAGRRFIVASTMMKFIVGDGYKDLRNWLQLILKLTSKLLAGAEVYKLYDCILSTCADPKRAHLYLSIVTALADPLLLSQILIPVRAVMPRRR
ncbi:hypothetical protein BDR04DRAFT_1164573 [Suillus decipiens]|nr:hypothetical protein BDR04DRAFT_1164573 [Suillus decipiens]